MLGSASAGPGQSTQRHGFGPSLRLARSAEFEQLLREGQRSTLGGFTFYVGRRTDGPPRLGVLISRRHAALSTERNRIKRCIREAFRLEQHRLGAVDILVRPPLGRARRSAEMIAQVRALLLKIK